MIPYLALTTTAQLATMDKPSDKTCAHRRFRVRAKMNRDADLVIGTRLFQIAHDGEVGER